MNQRRSIGFPFFQSRNSIPRVLNFKRLSALLRERMMEAARQSMFSNVRAEK
uniref:Uncharacterized protein n=1 Tax=Haemonchus placei TaxID=6290 RepID=A0A0N4WEN5_HAEPC